MKELGFEQLKSEAGIFCYKKTSTNTVIAVVYINDIFFVVPAKPYSTRLRVNSCKSGNVEI